MKRLGWTRLSTPGDKLRSMWRHESGILVRHCGHPTAIRPYYLIHPESGLPLVAEKFRNLELAMIAAESHVVVEVTEADALQRLCEAKAAGSTAEALGDSESS